MKYYFIKKILGCLIEVFGFFVKTVAPLLIHPKLGAEDFSGDFSGCIAAQGKVFFAADDQRRGLNLIQTFVSVIFIPI